MCSALSLEESSDYDVVKATVLCANELVPESYRQRFRKHAKTLNQTFVVFAHEKSVLFDKLCLDKCEEDIEGKPWNSITK